MAYLWVTVIGMLAVTLSILFSFLTERLSDANGSPYFWFLAVSLYVLYCWILSAVPVVLFNNKIDWRSYPLSVIRNLHDLVPLHMLKLNEDVSFKKKNAETETENLLKTVCGVEGKDTQRCNMFCLLCCSVLAGLHQSL